MRFPIAAVLVLVLAASGQQHQPIEPAAGPSSEGDVRLPSGKLQRDEILKADYEKSIAEARELARLADELKLDLEKNDRNVLSIATLKKTEEIERLAKRIHDRLKHF